MSILYKFDETYRVLLIIVTSYIDTQNIKNIIFKQWQANKTDLSHVVR